MHLPFCFVWTNLKILWRTFDYFLMLKIPHLFVPMGSDPSFPTRFPLPGSTACIFFTPRLTLRLPSWWMTSCLKLLGCVLSFIMPFFLSAMLLPASWSSAHHELSSQRLNPPGCNWWLSQGAMRLHPSQSHKACTSICIMSGTLHGPRTSSPPLSLAVNSQGEPHFYSCVSLLSASSWSLTE